MGRSVIGYPGFVGGAGLASSGPHRGLVVLGLTALLGLAGCAGAQAPTAAEQQAGEAPRAARVSHAAPETPPPVTPKPKPVVVPPAARQAVEDAYEAVRARRWDDLGRLAPLAAADPVLGLYPRYWALRQQLQNRAQPVPDAEVRRFLADSPGTYLNERIRADWIVAATRSGDYATALAVPALADPPAQARCALLLARHQTGKRARASEILDAFRYNTDCFALLDQAAADHVLDRKELNGLLRDTLETGKQRNAGRVAGVVFDDAAMVQYAALMKNPRKWLESRDQPRAGVDVELAAIALSRLARADDRPEAARYIQQRWVGWMPKSDLQWVWGQFGLVAALNVDPEAARWYRQSGAEPMTDYNHAWEVRAELRVAPQNWKRVAAAIRKMTDRQADEPVWRYWYGRALAAQGDAAGARKYYESIVDEQGFYGLLATEELGRTPRLPAQPGALNPGWIAQARANPGLQRAVALFDLGWRREAVPEWNFALRGMSDSQLRGAAEFAREEQIYDRVVNTSQLTQDVADFSQRFIAPFEGQVEAKARLINLDTAWVYGLIRQESRFITDARSRVGASGLMQLMPATARHVARKIGMKNFSPSQVTDFDTNTILGTNYLNMVLQDLDGSELLATAGYNAGPGRPKRWRAQLPAPVEGAVFAETIPFTETRLYVKNVLSNTVYYAMLFTGRPDSLKARLGTVGATTVTRTARP